VAQTQDAGQSAATVERIGVSGHTDYGGGDPHMASANNGGGEAKMEVLRHGPLI